VKLETCRATLFKMVMLLVLVACHNDIGQPTDDTPIITLSGTPTGSAVTQTIGAEGGILSSADGQLTLIVPAGALTLQTPITVQPISNNAPGGVGLGYRLTPSDLRFKVPVELRLAYSDSNAMGGSSELLGLAVQDAQGQWIARKSVKLVTGAMQTMVPAVVPANGASKTVGVSTKGLGDWTLYWAFWLSPIAASIKVGASQGLTLVTCLKRDENGELLEEEQIMKTCRSDPQFRAEEWSVNNTNGGDIFLGTVKGDASKGIYIAPSKLSDTTRDFTVSALVTIPTKAGSVKRKAISNVTVTDCFGFPNMLRVKLASNTCTDAWSGTSSKAEYNDPSGVFVGTEPAISATGIRWELIPEESTATFRSYRHVSGLATTAKPPPGNGCTVTNIQPISSAIDRDTDVLGRLLVDYAQQPPTFNFSGRAVWLANVTTECQLGAGPPTKTSEAFVGGPWGAGEGVLSVDGSTISGAFTDTDGRRYNFEFKRE
jgi:hypothetical protein